MRELSTCPLGNMRVDCLKTLKKLSMCLPGNTPSAPSVFSFPPSSPRMIDRYPTRVSWRPNDHFASHRYKIAWLTCGISGDPSGA